MAIERDDPYGGFAFLVSLGGDAGDPGGPAAGFLRVSGLDRRVGLLRYRAGNDRSLAPRLVTGLAEPVQVVFERGVIGSLDLQQWVQTALDGQAERRDLTVDLLAEDLSSVVTSWRLRRALPTSLIGPTLDAMANEVAIEKLTVVAESLTVA
jgi:phage tail-like protein